MLTLLEFLKDSGYFITREECFFPNDIVDRVSTGVKEYIEEKLGFLESVTRYVLFQFGVNVFSELRGIHVLKSMILLCCSYVRL